MSLISHNRMSTYGPYRKCMDKDVDVKLCVCNDPKNPQPQSSIKSVFGKHSEIWKIQQCLYEIRRTYNNRKNERLVTVYEIANICRNREFSVKFGVSGENIMLSTKTPITVKLPPQTAQFIATVRTIGNIRDSKQHITWHTEETKSARR